MLGRDIDQYILAVLVGIVRHAPPCLLQIAENQTAFVRRMMALLQLGEQGLIEFALWAHLFQEEVETVGRRHAEGFGEKGFSRAVYLHIKEGAVADRRKGVVRVSHIELVEQELGVDIAETLSHRISEIGFREVVLQSGIDTVDGVQGVEIKMFGTLKVGFYL